MEYLLMNKDVPVLLFNLEETDNYVVVLNNTMLPFMLRDYIKTSSIESLATINKMTTDISAVKDFLCSRLLNLSRSGAKTILNVANLPQSLKTAEKLKISIACRGLTMTDDFWLKKPDEDIEYKDVCLRKNKLSHKSYDVSILEKHISATRDELRPDLSTVGMFPKFWHRREDSTTELWKTDRTSDFSNTQAELLVSEILDSSSIPHVKYRKEERDGKIFAVSECFVNDKYTFVSAEDVKDYIDHTRKEITIADVQLQDFANMVCIDYVLANTDRHLGNFGFLVDKNNDIISYAPLFDHNQALLADSEGLETNIDILVYEPTGLSYLESVEKYAKYADFSLDVTKLPEKCKGRYMKVEKERNAKTEEILR